MVFAEDAPVEFAGGEFYQKSGSAFYSSDDKLAGDYSPVRYSREIGLLRKFVSRGRVLDVGCSTGGFLYYLRCKFPDDYQITGTDVATGALEIAAGKGVPVLREDFLQLGDVTYDAITFWAVLEHVAEPGKFLTKARSLLSAQGCCFALVPNIRSLAVRILGAKYRYILPQHLNYFSLQTLRHLFERCGFEVTYSSTTHFNPVVILQDYRSKSGLVPDQERAALLVKTNALKANPLLAPVRACYRITESLLARTGLADNAVIVARRSSTA
jgi:2-polyprenyl-3-methyl-5-hydroxy-6-metoxy-1,4-benzoquinol methylase